MTIAGMTDETTISVPSSVAPTFTSILSEFSLSMAEDPTNNQNAVEVYVTSAGQRLGMSYSTDGGLSWTGVLNTDPGGTDLYLSITDPTINSTPPTPFSQVTNPTVAWDRFGNIYVTAIERNAANTSGALVFEKF